MPGAGGGKAANYLFNAAPKDGSVMLSTHAIPILEKMRGKGIRFKSGEMTWIGSMGQINQLMAVWHTSPVTTLAGMKNTQLVIGAFYTVRRRPRCRVSTWCWGDRRLRARSL
jgi:tripartite-type tricarboxylate transporter receptor subunit TctC